MRIWIPGTGMLGARTYAAALARDHYVKSTSHIACPIDDIVSVMRAVEEIKPDVIINCAGALPGARGRDMVLTNTLGPHNLHRTGVRLIQMSTDCVFSGRGSGGHHSSKDLPDPDTLYGRTKLAGEVGLVVRGSFIDPAGGFLKWLLSAKGEINAWERAYWNGTSAETMGRTLVGLAEASGGYLDDDVIHVASRDVTSKADMVREVLKYHQDSKVTAVRSVFEPVIGRSLEPDLMVDPPDYCKLASCAVST